MSTPAIPDLEFSCPPCALCGEETNYEDGYFDCGNCQLSWPKEGRDGFRANHEIPQCLTERSPFTHYEDVVIRKRRYCCLLDAEHPLPHRGVRIDDLDGYDTHEWSDVDQEAGVRA
jgi:hypothetical protein